MGKALRNIDFLRFFNKKINNFPTKIDMDLIYLIYLIYLMYYLKDFLLVC